jgi:phage shock protein PspC (stress-responsive transcriptional regulator)
MNKVITINLNGVAYQLEEGGYDALRAYLDHAARRLEGNPDKDEIITDIEQAIADKFRALLGAYKTVVNAKEVSAVLTEMGPVEDTTDDSAAAGATASVGAGQGNAKRTDQSGADGASAAAPRRLYTISEGAMIGGVCNGLAAYVNIDVTIVRLAFTLLTFLWGAGILVYLLMMVIVPEARTPAEKAAASGMAATAQEFIKRAREGYYEGMKSFHDKQARRAWKRKFKQDMRGWKYGFRRQMQEQSQQWQQNWQGHWAQHPPGILGPVFIAPLLSLLLFALVALMVYAIYALATAHAVFGLVMPASMPLWVAIVLVVIAYQFVAWPIKMARYSCYYPGHHPCGHGAPWGGFFGSLIGLFFLAFGIWMLDRHVPEFHEWLVQLPALLHRLVDTVQGWFAQKG